MSMPPLAQWEYAHVPEEGSKEKRTLELLKKGVDWVDVMNV
jgi:coproporphyrinogen III oxidase